jgi:hypothetical protein
VNLTVVHDFLNAVHVNKIRILIKREWRVWSGKLDRWQRKWRSVGAPRREIQLELPLR